MAVEHRNIHIADLAKYIFEENLQQQNEIFLDVRTLQTNKQLFLFFFELFCKGLVILFGSAEGRLELNSVSSEQFDVVRECLRRAHIKLKLTTYDADMARLLDHDVTSSRNVADRSAAQLRDADEDLPLDEYTFEIFVNNVLMIISFDVV